MTRPSNPSTPPPLPLDPISQWRALQTLSIIFTFLINRQIRRRWLLEQKCMEGKPLCERFRPLIFLEAVPALQKPTQDQPINTTTLGALREKVALLRARVEKGKELAGEIERRMVATPAIRYPTHFCHTCVQDGELVEVLLTKCGHRVCRTCLEFGVDGAGIYMCSICFAPAEFVTRSPLALGHACSEQILSTLSRGNGVGSEVDGKMGKGRTASETVL